METSSTAAGPFPSQNHSPATPLLPKNSSPAAITRLLPLPHRFLLPPASTVAQYFTILVIGVAIGFYTDSLISGVHSPFYNAATSPACDRALGTYLVSGTRRVASGAAGLCERQHAAPANWTGVQLPDAQLRFFVLGDWGRDGFCCQNDVAVEMANAASGGGKPQLVLNTGDNFYPSGVASVDSPQWDTSWRNVYLGFESIGDVPWWSVLGNHDYVGEIQPQLQFSARDDRWVMPAKRWVREVDLKPTGSTALFIMIDTTPLYYGTDPENLDTFGYQSHEGAEQLEWLQDQLSKATASWTFVVGHHPVISRGSHAGEELESFLRMKRELQPLLEDNNVDAYFCGHDHDMQHLQEGGVNFFISGAGSQVRDLYNSVDLQHTTPGLFGIGRQGFAIVNVMNPQAMHLQFIDYKGSVVYQTEINKT